MSEEIWKDIPGFETKYQVSSFGRVRSLPRKHIDTQGRKCNHSGKMLTHNITRNGRALVRLFKDNKGTTLQVHRVVAEAFLGKSSLEVNHKDKNPLNNHISNLEYMTRRQNMHHSRMGLRDLPIGVTRLHKGYLSQICINGKPHKLGYFPTPEEAHAVYINKLNEIGGL